MILNGDKGEWKRMAVLIAGTLLIAISVNWVYDPAGIVTGGVTGMGIIIKELSTHFLPVEIPIWLTNLLVNVPLLLISLKNFGKKFVTRTLLATGLLSLFIYLIPGMHLFAEDLLLASVFGGVIGGAGMGLVLSTRSTTGGTDLLAMLLHEKRKHFSIPQLLMVIDGLVVIAGIFVFGINRALYAIISVYIANKISDGILEGMKFAKTAYIISDCYQEIAQEILTALNRGVTGIRITGMYSNTEKKMLFCVVSKKEMVEVLDIVHKKDPRAFVIISDAREVMGEGFIEFKQ